MCSVLISYCVCRWPSWTPKTQPNDSSAVVWLSFWCSTRFTRKKCLSQWRETCRVHSYNCGYVVFGQPLIVNERKRATQIVDHIIKCYQIQAVLVNMATILWWQYIWWRTFDNMYIWRRTHMVTNSFGYTYFWLRNFWWQTKRNHFFHY